MFGKIGKLSHRYVGYYKILRYIGKVVGVLDLSLELAMVHLKFHVTMLRKFVGVMPSILS